MGGCTVSGVCGCKKLAMIGASQQGAVGGSLEGHPLLLGQLRCQEATALPTPNLSYNLNAAVRTAEISCKF